MIQVIQLGGLALAGVVVLAGARRELRHLPYGSIAWWVLAVFVAATVIFVSVQLWRHENVPRPPVVIPTEGGIAA